MIELPNLTREEQATQAAGLRLTAARLRDNAANFTGDSHRFMLETASFIDRHLDDGEPALAIMGTMQEPLVLCQTLIQGARDAATATTD